MAGKIDRARFPHMTPDNLWISEHFGELIEKYAGKCIAVVDEKVVCVGDSTYEVDREARRLYPDVIPSVLRVPYPEDLKCLL